MRCRLMARPASVPRRQCRHSHAMIDDPLTTADGLRCTARLAVRAARAARCHRARPRRAHRPLCARRRAPQRPRLARRRLRPARPRRERRRARPARRRRRPAARPGARRSTRCAPSTAARWCCSATASAAWSPRASSPARSTPAPPRGTRPVDALVLSSPALDTGMNAAQKALLAVLGPLTPNLAVGNGLKPEWISRDAGGRRRLQAPIRWCTTGSRRGSPASSSTAAQFVLRARAALDACRRCCCTPAATAASRRPAAPPSRRRRRSASSRAREFRPLFHEIFNEPEQARGLVGARATWLDTLARSPPHEGARR